MARPKFVLASLAVDAPVPPSAISISSISVILPPVIFTLLTSCVAILPRFKAILLFSGFFFTKVVPSPTIKKFFVGSRAAISVISLS